MTALPPCPPPAPIDSRAAASLPRANAEQPGAAPPRRMIEVATVSPAERARAALLVAAIVAALLFLWRYDPSDNPRFLQCPTAMIGVYCPGCGSTRAAHHLLNARLDAAWRYNPLLVAVGVPLGAAYLGALTSAVLLGLRPIWRPPARIAFAIVVLLLLYMAVRNVPAPQLDWLRPPSTWP